MCCVVNIFDRAPIEISIGFGLIQRRSRVKRTHFHIIEYQKLALSYTARSSAVTFLSTRNQTTKGIPSYSPSRGSVYAEVI